MGAHQQAVQTPQHATQERQTDSTPLILKKTREGVAFKDKEQVYYFSHDLNARNDKKIRKIRRKYGDAAYAWYFFILERCREADNYKLSFAEDEDLPLIADDCFKDGQRFTIEETLEFIQTCIDCGLFESDGEYFWSASFLQRMYKYEESKAKHSKAGKASAEKRRMARFNDVPEVEDLSLENILLDNDENEEYLTTLQHRSNTVPTIKEKNIKEKEKEKNISVYQMPHTDIEFINSLQDETRKAIITNMLKAIPEKYPRTAKMPRQLTASEVNTLLNDFTVDELRAKLKKIENWDGVERKQGVYLTLDEFITKDRQEGKRPPRRVDGGAYG